MVLLKAGEGSCVYEHAYIVFDVIFYFSPPQILPFGSACFFPRFLFSVQGFWILEASELCEWNKLGIFHVYYLYVFPEFEVCFWIKISIISGNVTVGQA